MYKGEGKETMHTAKKVVDQVGPKTAGDKVHDKEDEDRGKVWISPIHSFHRGVFAVVVAHTNHFPDPCGEKRDCHNSQADERSCFAFPFGQVSPLEACVVEKENQGVHFW